MENIIERKYYDRNGKEITEGCTIVFPGYATGERFKVYRTETGELGTDATNPAWIKSGRAVPCEYGIFPLNHSDEKSCQVVFESGEV